MGDLNGITSRLDYLKDLWDRCHLDHALLSVAASDLGRVVWIQNGRA